MDLRVVAVFWTLYSLPSSFQGFWVGILYLWCVGVIPTPSRCLVFWTVYSLLWIYARPVGSVTRVFGPMFDWLDGFYGAIKMALFNFGDMAD